MRMLEIVNGSLIKFKKTILVLLLILSLFWFILFSQFDGNNLIILTVNCTDSKCKSYDKNVQQRNHTTISNLVIVTNVNVEVINNKEKEIDYYVTQVFTRKSASFHTGHSSEMKNNVALANFLFKDDFNFNKKADSAHLVDETSKLIWLKKLVAKEWISEEIYIIGELISHKRYSIFSSSTDGKASLNYLFYMPLTILSWKRIGFSSIIIFVGSHSNWHNDQLIKFVIQQCVDMEAVLIFINCRPQFSVMLSQVSRIFASVMLAPHFPNVTDVYLITSDADLWPLNENIYIIPNNKTILSLNSECCSSFKHGGQSYKMLPVVNIGIKMNAWLDLTQHLMMNLSSSVNDLLIYLSNEFGTPAAEPVHKGENKGWYLDQMVVSILIARWQKISPQSIEYVPRNIGHDRIDRNNWVVDGDIGNKNDVHLIGDAFREKNMIKLLPLLKLMYGSNSYAYDYFLKYFKTFRNKMRT